MVSKEDKSKSYRVKREVLECIDTSSAHGVFFFKYLLLSNIARV